MIVRPDLDFIPLRLTAAIIDGFKVIPIHEERIIADRSDAVGNYDARQAGTMHERLIADKSNAIGNDDTCQTSAKSKCLIADKSNTVWDDNARQAVAFKECCTPM